MRIISFVLSLVLVLRLSVPVLADGSQAVEPVTEPLHTETVPTESTAPLESETAEITESTTPATEAPVTETEPILTTLLEIDTKHLYEGMDRPYENGYIPKITDGTVQIVLPLRSLSSIRDNRIKASLELGAGNELPFVVANYEKDFYPEQVMPQNSKEEQNIYLVYFNVKLTEDRINGTYPVTIRISAYDENNQPVSMDYTVFVTITDGRSGEPEIPAAPEPEKPTAEPVIYISSAKLEPKIAMAGESFTLTLTLQNSLANKSVENLLVTVEPGNLQINLLEDSTVIPVQHIAAGGDATLVLHFDTDPSISAEKHKINFHFQYDSNETLGLHSEGSYILDVRQSAQLDYDGAVLPAKVFQQDTVTFSINLMNTGKSPLYNCRIDYEIDGLTSGGTTFLGEIPAGENKVGSGNLRVSSSQLGEVKGTVLIAYEDAFGQKYTQTAEISTNIAEKPEPESTEPKKSEKKDVHWWIFILVGLAAGGGIGFGIPWFLKDRKQRKEDDLRL